MARELFAVDARLLDNPNPRSIRLIDLNAPLLADALGTGLGFAGGKQTERELQKSEYVREVADKRHQPNPPLGHWLVLSCHEKARREGGGRETGCRRRSDAN
jgi:hypothetical protein